MEVRVSTECVIDPDRLVRRDRIIVLADLDDAEELGVAGFEGHEFLLRL